MRARKRGSLRKKLAVLLAVGAVLGCFLAADRQLRRAVPELVSYRVHQLAMELMSESAARGRQEARQLVTVTTAPDGSVASVQTDTEGVIRVKAAALETLQERLSDLGERELTIPLGDLLAGQWLSGRGPDVRFRFRPEGAVTARTVSSFTGCGVNQSCHRITLSMTVTVGAVSSFGSVSVPVESEFILAETVIVGETPQSFTQVLTEDRELVRDIADFAGEG